MKNTTKKQTTFEIICEGIGFLVIAAAIIAAVYIVICCIIGGGIFFFTGSSEKIDALFHFQSTDYPADKQHLEIKIDEAQQSGEDNRAFQQDEIQALFREKAAQADTIKDLQSRIQKLEFEQPQPMLCVTNFLWGNLIMTNGWIATNSLSGQ